MLHRKHRKPPFIGGMGRYILLLLLLLSLHISTIAAQSTTPKDDEDGGIEITVVTTPTSLTFSVNDPESYEIQDVTCKSVKSLEETESKEHTCDNLDPCTTYRATLLIKDLNDENQTITENTIDAATDYVEPTTEITDIEAFTETINMTWSVKDVTCVSEYVIEVKSSDKDFKWTVTKDKNQLLLDGLSPCQEYAIQLKTYDVNSVMVSNKTADSATAYAEPGDITVTLEPYDNAQMRVTWETPTYKTCINYYYLKWSIVDCTLDLDGRSSTPANVLNEEENEIISSDEGKGNDSNQQSDEIEGVCEWTANITDANSKEYIISGLHGCENYIFQMFVNSDTNEKTDPKFFTAPEQVPGSITIGTSDITATDITLNWEPPTTNTKCVDGYRVLLVGPLQRSTEEQDSILTDTIDPSISFRSLDPCGKYNFTIAVISLDGTLGASVSSDLETKETQPTAIQNYAVEQEPNALTISWEPPGFADLCLNGYRVTGWNDKNVPVSAFEQTTNDTTIRVEGLYSCQAYTIQVIPQTTNDMDGELQLIETETGAIAATAPNNLQATGLHPNSLELSAQDADLNNKCETIFARFVCELSKTVDVPYKSAESYVEGQVGGISFKAVLSPLSPYTDYKCSVALFNIAGWSPNRTIIKKTEPYFPEAPASVNFKTKTNNSINFVWTEPKYPNGNIKLYILHFQSVRANFYIPPSCSSLTRDPVIRQTSSLEQSFTALYPYTIYSIQVAAENEYGVGEYTKPFMTLTESFTPGAVTNLKAVAEGPYESDEEYRANVVVSWMTPCRSNGEIETFVLQFIGERDNYPDENFTLNVEPNFENDGNIVHNETNLKPQYSYRVSVVVKNKNYSVTSSEVQKTFDAPAGIPKKLDETATEQTRVDPYEASNPTKSAVIRFPASVLESDSGTITYVAILLSEKSCQAEPQMRYAALNTQQDWPDIPNWSEAYDDGGCITQYQTTPLRWKPTTTKNYRVSSDIEEEFIEYTIGTDSCDSRSSEYCNGFLRPDTEYYVILRLFTNAGYNDAAMMDFKTDSLIQLTLILVSVSSCLILAFVFGFIYYWVTKRMQSKRNSCHGIEDPFGNVTGKNFALYFREVSKPDKVAREFKELTTVAIDLSTSASELGVNKNRYADIFPYDKNRVILDIDAEGSDYINASFIDGYRRKKEYIATQGPKPESTMDFWRMVLQHNVKIIVMVTQFREGNTIKCHDYFPFKFKGINVTVKKKDTFELYDRTEMTVVHDKYSMKQKVVHFYFKKWPDHGCPTDPMQVITFIRKVKAEKVPSYSPIVVHCSAGVGRTGTFIGLDIIMQRLKAESKINIYETVRKLRFQRMKMVQTLMQYRFLYTCTYELVKYKVKNAPPVPRYEKNKQKKVNFEEEIIEEGTPSRAAPKRQNGSGSDLSSFDENENRMSTFSTPTKQVDALNYDTTVAESQG